MSFNKMVLVPVDSQVGGNELPAENLVIEKPKRIERNPEKIQRLLKIALKIASLDAYDEDFKIKDSNGNPIEDSDIVALLNNAISNQKLLVGENDFIRLLFEAKVDPNWIVNENMRSKLLNYRPSNTRPKQPPKEPPKPPEQTIPEQIHTSAPPNIPQTPNLPTKRKGEETIKVNKKQKPVQAWEVPLPEDGDDDL